MSIDPLAVAQVLREAVKLANALMDAAFLAESPAQVDECRTVARQVWQAAAQLRDELPAGHPEWTDLRLQIEELEKRLA